MRYLRQFEECHSSARKFIIAYQSPPFPGLSYWGKIQAGVPIQFEGVWTCEIYLPSPDRTRWGDSTSYKSPGAVICTLFWLGKKFKAPKEMWDRSLGIEAFSTLEHLRSAWIASQTTQTSSYVRMCLHRKTEVRHKTRPTMLNVSKNITGNRTSILIKFCFNLKMNAFVKSYVDMTNCPMPPVVDFKGSWGSSTVQSMNVVGRVFWYESCWPSSRRSYHYSQHTTIVLPPAPAAQNDWLAQAAGWAIHVKQVLKPSWLEFMPR